MKYFSITENFFNLNNNNNNNNIITAYGNINTR